MSNWYGFSSLNARLDFFTSSLSIHKILLCLSISAGHKSKYIRGKQNSDRYIVGLWLTVCTTVKWLKLNYNLVQSLSRSVSVLHSLTMSTFPDFGFIMKGEKVMYFFFQIS